MMPLGVSGLFHVTLTEVELVLKAATLSGALGAVHVEKEEHAHIVMHNGSFYNSNNYYVCHYNTVQYCVAVIFYGTFKSHDRVRYIILPCSLGSIRTVLQLYSRNKGDNIIGTVLYVHDECVSVYVHKPPCTVNVTVLFKGPQPASVQACTETE